MPMSDTEIEIVVDDPTAPEDNSPAVTSVRAVDIVVSLLLLALAATLGYDNWRTGIAWDSTGPQPGYFPFYLSVILAGASLYGLVAAWLSRKEAAETFVTRAQLRRVMAVFVPTLLFCLVTQFLGLYVASFLLIAGFMRLVGKIALWKSLLTAFVFTADHVRDLRYRVRRHHAEGTARSGLRLLASRRDNQTMEAFGLLLHGFAVLLTWKTLALMMVGLVLGIFVGVLPGLGGPNGVAILLPLTFTMDPTSAIVMLSCIYWGALFGGAITSILFNIPGEAWSVATTFDGYPMAQQGRAAEALTAAFTSSFIGSLVAVLLITFLAPLISSFALKFGPPEFFAVYLLTFCSFVGLGREDKHKTVISMSLGLLLAGVGMDTVSGQLRMTFGSTELLRGINFLVAVIGLFGISEILLTMEERLALRGHAASISLRVVLSVWKDLPKYWVTLLRSSFIGCWLGITPGGAIAASFMGYNLAKRFSKDPGQLRQGPHRGRVRAGDRGACLRHRGAAADAGARHSRLRHRGDPARRADGVGPQSRTAAVRRAQGFRLGPDRLDVSRQRRRPRAGADHGADLRLDPARAVRRGGADDRGVLRDRRLCDPERDVRHLADAAASASSATSSRRSAFRWRRSRSRWCSAAAPRMRSACR